MWGGGGGCARGRGQRSTMEWKVCVGFNSSQGTNSNHAVTGGIVKQSDVWWTKLVCVCGRMWGGGGGGGGGRGCARGMGQRSTMEWKDSSVHKGLINCNRRDCETLRCTCMVDKTCGRMWGGGGGGGCRGQRSTMCVGFNSSQ